MMIGENIDNYEFFWTNWIKNRIIAEYQPGQLALGKTDMFDGCARAGCSTLRTESARTDIFIKMRILRL
jgi:hypothetical protein